MQLGELHALSLFILSSWYPFSRQRTLPTLLPLNPESQRQNDLQSFNRCIAVVSFFAFC